MFKTALYNIIKSVIKKFMYIYDKKICFLAINFGYLLVSELTSGRAKRT